MNKTILPLTQELLKDRLAYCPETGIFTRNKLCGGKRAGETAGTLHWKGYVYIRLGNKKYYAHRLAFLYMTGSIPSQIDHIDGVRHNNRWVNLRSADNFINSQNIRSNRKNTVGFFGVTLRKDGTYRAQIGYTVEGKKKKMSIGDFKTPEEAHDAYLAKKRILHKGCTI